MNQYVTAIEPQTERAFVFPHYDYHELAMLFNRMSEDSFLILVKDIAVNGLMEPIVLYNDKIIDGRHRYEACRQAAVQPRFVKYEGSDPFQFVRSANVHRRHLSATQAAVAVALLQDWSHAPKHGGARRKAGDAGATSAVRAATAGVGVRSQKSADALVQADAEVAAMVVRGEISFADARKQLGLDRSADRTCDCEDCKAIDRKIADLRKKKADCKKSAAIAA